MDIPPAVPVLPAAGRSISFALRPVPFRSSTTCCSAVARRVGDLGIDGRHLLVLRLGRELDHVLSSHATSLIHVHRGPACPRSRRPSRHPPCRPLTHRRSVRAPAPARSRSAAGTPLRDARGLGHLADLLRTVLHLLVDQVVERGVHRLLGGGQQAHPAVVLTELVVVTYRRGSRSARRPRTCPSRVFPSFSAAATANGLNVAPGLVVAGGPVDLALDVVRSAVSSRRAPGLGMETRPGRRAGPLCFFRVASCR